MANKDKDIRWIQRFSNYKKALGQLTEFLTKTGLNKLEEQGLIQAFEYTHELAWKTLKDFLEDRGQGEIYGSKDVTREAFKLALVQDGDVWMNMIKSRNLSSHTYNEQTSLEIVEAIKEQYHKAFIQLETTLQSIQDK